VNELQETHNETIESAGLVLQEERRRQSLSVGDVSRHLKLSVRQVESLENDEFEVFGGPVFVHGFLRNYAKLLGLDAGNLIEAADRSLMPQVNAENGVAGVTMSNDNPQKSVIPLLLMAAILIFGVLGWMLGRDNQQPDEPPSAQENARSKPRTADSQDESAALTEPGGEVPVADGPVAPLPDRRVSDVAPGVMRLVFDEESWVEVTDRDGAVILSELGEPGTARTVSGLPPLAVVIGNTAGVTLTYNDQAVDLASYARADVARLTLE
jgi:cytoskeleton protein RodZ